MAQQLTPQQQQRLVEYFLCKKDPIYFMEKYVKLALVGGDVTVPLYDRQKDFVKEVIQSNHVIVLKSRQTGVSTITQMYCAYAMVFFKNVVIGVVSKSGPESTDFCRKVLAILDSLPDWLRPTFNKRSEQSFILDNGCQFFASQVDQSNPEGLLRGKAITILIVDEAAFISKIDEAYTGVAPTLFKSQTSAKQNNVPFATIVISTPNKTVGKGKWFFQNWNKSINGESIFKPFKLHWKMIKEFAEDPNWYKTQCKLLGNIHWKIAQELDMQFVASNNSYLPSETIELLNTIRQEPHYKMSVGKFDLWQFETPDQSKYYLIGIDTASSSGSDSSSIEIFDFETFTQVAEFRAKMRVDEFCEVIALINRIYPNNIIIPEANSYGNQVCEFLTKNDTFYNIYQTKLKSNTTVQPKTQKYRYGLTTGSQNRPLMMDALYTSVVENPNIIKSERLALELIGLVDNGNGKVMADEGEHDDLALSLAFCAYVRTYDPPLAIARSMKNIKDLTEMTEVAHWNDEPRIPAQSELQEIKDFASNDQMEVMEHSNKILNKYVKSNLKRIIENNANGTTIDILKILDLRNQKNQKF